MQTTSLFAYNLFILQKFKATIPTNDVAELDFGSYDVPNGGDNELGSIGYSTEFFYSKSGKPNAPERTLWFQTSQNWLEVSSRLEVSYLSLIRNILIRFAAS